MRRAGLLLMAAAATLSASSAHAKIVISSDRGGNIKDYAERFFSVRTSGEQVVIDGACLVIVMVPRDKVCVTPNAVLGFNSAWRPGPDGKHEHSEATTQMMLNAYPAELRKWIAERGGLTPKMIYLRGQELAEFVMPCDSPALAKPAQDVARQGPAALPTRPAAPPAPPATEPRRPQVAAPISRPATTFSGSGVVISTGGEILTNAHVVESCSDITVRFSAGNSEAAILVARDQKNDLAVIRADATKCSDS
jgi:S1-C subfamily serine protease